MITTVINKVVLDFFRSNPEVHTIAAKELMPQMVAAGVYSKNHRDGLPLRNDLRDLQRANQLHLIPTLVGIKKKTITNWFFQRIATAEVERQPKAWLKYCTQKLNLLCNKQPQPFSEIRSKLPITGGIYLISLAPVNGKEKPLYVGRTINLKQRIYTNHLQGPLSSARLKKYLLADIEWNIDQKQTLLHAKDYILKNCNVRWITTEEIEKGNPYPKEHQHRVRGALEGYLTGVLFPRYGIYKEH
jgi:hypothetical protein